MFSLPKTSSTEESIDSSSSYVNFPPPPKLSNTASYSPRLTYNSASDSSLSDLQEIKLKRKSKRKNVKTLPAIGVFWDIENCQVPKTKSATLVVQQIRELFYNDYREAEFLVVCDVKKESAQVVSDLNDAQVNLIHVSSTSKNAADEKLRQSLRRFSELHKIPCAIALISGDVNFAADLSDLRYRKKMHVILIHNNNVADALILCANETYNFTTIIEKVPANSKMKPVANQQVDLLVFNLPFNICNDMGRLKSRLKLLSDNCGGRVLAVHRELGYAVIRFSSSDFAKRAQKRLDGEDVFGNKIQVSQPLIGKESLVKNYTGRKARGEDVSQIRSKSDQHPKNNLWLLEPNKVSTVSKAHFPSRDTATLEMVPVCVKGQDNYPCNGEESKMRPIELLISNLDVSIDTKELSTILLNKLKQYVMVLNFTLKVQTDGALAAIITIGTQQEAQLVISHLHHQRIGSKRITISYMQPKSDSEQLRHMVTALLQETPNNRMPLFKFFGLVEDRYQCNISLSEINQLKDICKVTTGQGGRMISLTNKGVVSLSLQGSLSLHAYCTFHCPEGQENRGWGEALDFSLPNIKISLRLFESQVNKLLRSHFGCLPLLSFPICYAIEIGQVLPENEYGVPLEHLITCIDNVQLVCDKQNRNIKYLQWKSEGNKEEVHNNNAPSVLMPNVTIFCREVVDLLKTVENCQLLLLRYIPTYHHHFGRQCRVADYGFTRLVDLFEAISHAVQILGYGSKRIVTLTHATQMRRFTSDLLRVLKGQALKRVAVSNFVAAYQNTFHKAFNPVEYGLCSFEDLISELQEGVVVIASIDNVETICIPKREQTAEEIQRTKQFSLEVQQLLSHTPYCSMLFNKFVPAYHHHFGRQCKVSDYGFSKLVELFEALPDVVDMEGQCDVDRNIKLKSHLALEILGVQIQAIIKESNYSAIHIEDVFANFRQRHGYSLKPEMYNCKDHLELVHTLNDFVQVIHGSAGTLLAITVVDISVLKMRVWGLLLQPPHMSTITKFIYDYRVRFLGTLPITKLEQLKSVIVMSNNGAETFVCLTPYYILAAQLYHLMFVNGGCIPLADVNKIYFRKFGSYLYASDYGLNCLEDLFKQMSFALTIVTSGKQLNVVLNEKLSDYRIELPTVVKLEQSSNWPSTSTHLYRNCFSPPKPDMSFLDDGWSNFSIRNEADAKSQSQHYTNSSAFIASIPKISSPHPTNLPTPDKLMSQDDSGVNTSRNDFTMFYNDNSLSENEHLSIGGTSQPRNFNKIMFNFNM